MNLQKHRTKTLKLNKNPLESERTNLLDEVVSLRKEMQEAYLLKTEVSFLKEQIEQERKNLADIKAEIEKVNLGELNKEITEAKKEKNLLDTQVNIQEAKYNILKNENEELGTKKDKLKQEIVIFIDTNDKLKTDISQNKKEAGQLVITRDSVKKFTLEEEKLKKSIAELEVKQDTLNKENIKLAKQNADNKQEFENREGSISKNETRLSKAEARLKTLKQELETYYNRKFPYIVI